MPAHQEREPRRCIIALAAGSLTSSPVIIFVDHVLTRHLLELVTVLDVKLTTEQ